MEALLVELRKVEKPLGRGRGVRLMPLIALVFVGFGVAGGRRLLLETCATIYTETTCVSVYPVP